VLKGEIKIFFIRHLDPSQEDVPELDSGHFELSEGREDVGSAAGERTAFKTLFVKESHKLPEKHAIKGLTIEIIGPTLETAC
jgi:hypothetical protein